MENKGTIRSLLSEGRGTRKQQTPLFNCLGETPRTTRIEDAPLVRKHNGLAVSMEEG